MGKFLLPKSNVVLDQYKFLRRVQLPHETFNEYLYDIKKIANSCKLEDQLVNFLRVQIVIVVNDPVLQERLNQVVEHCKDAENAKQSRSILQKKTEPVEVYSFQKSNLGGESKSFKNLFVNL